MKKAVFACVLFFIIQATFGQEYQIKGRIVSHNNFPVEYANVIIRTNDSIFVSGGITDQRGRFQMENIRKGNYNLQVSGIGYETKNLELKDFMKDMDLGNISVDSASVALDEVTITANYVINQPDRKIVLPRPAQIKSSTNALSLLQQLQLSRINVDMIRKKVSVAGGDNVQIRINGVQASVDEISALRAEDILRVEFHDDPGLRYNGADAVIDYITRRKQSGGYVSFETETSPHVVFSNNRFTAKYNYKKSEFSAVYSGGFRGFKEMLRENTETFKFEDGSSLTRIEDGIPDKWSTHWDYVHLNYSYQEPEKRFFNVTARAKLYGSPKEYYRSNLYPVGYPEKGVYMTDRSSNEDIIPSIDLYYQESLKNKQTLIFNLVGTYINSDSEREYKEIKEDELLTDISSNVKGNKYSLIGEGIYEKGFSTGKLSAGLKHTQSTSDNEYSGSTVAETKMNQSETYAYVEYQGKINKFNYSVGVGGTRSWFRQSGEGYSNFTFRPTLRLTYNIDKNSFIRYRGNLYNASPSLSDLSETEQLIDSLQIRRGNPNLKPKNRISNSLLYDMRYGIFSATLNVQHWYYHKPIMEQTIRENDKFVRTVDNQKSWQKLNTELELKLRPLKDMLTLSFTTGINYFDSKGHNYHHNYTNWYYEAQALFNYKNWISSFAIQNHRNNFYGETLNYGENYHVLSLQYKHKRLTCGVISFLPFTNNWKIGRENRSEFASSKNWQYLKDTSRVFCLSLSYNFSFGRTYESGSKRLNNSDNESGVLSGGK